MTLKEMSDKYSVSEECSHVETTIVSALVRFRGIDGSRTGRSKCGLRVDPCVRGERHVFSSAVRTPQGKRRVSVDRVVFSSHFEHFQPPDRSKAP